MKNNKNVPATKLFKELWEHVVREDRYASSCLLAIKDALSEALSREMPNLRSLHIISERIGKHIEFVNDGRTLMISKTEGEWHITNADIVLWSDLSFFGRRDYFPQWWPALSSRITEALHNKRRWQAYERYCTNGRLRDEHRRLMSRLFWDLSLWRSDGVSLYVQGKRPFGNSSIVTDMLDALGWDVPESEDDKLPTEIEEKCWELFDELQFAIQEALANEAEYEEEKKKKERLIWMDKIIEAQKWQKEIIEGIAHPCEVAALCEYIKEEDEPPLKTEMSSQTTERSRR